MRDEIALFSQEKQHWLKLPEDKTFSDLAIIQGQEDNTVDILVIFESETIAWLNDTNAVEIAQSDFVI